MGFRVWGFGCGVLGVGFWVWVFGCRFLGVGFWVWVFGCGVEGLGLRVVSGRPAKEELLRTLRCSFQPQRMVYKLRVVRLNGGTTRAEDAEGTPTQSHTSPGILVYAD